VEIIIKEKGIMEDMNKFKLGAIPSGKDERDFNISKLVATVNVFPSEFCLDLDGIEIQDQGEVGCCVGESLAYTRFLTEKKQTAKTDLFSVGFIYGTREETDYQEDGMRPREALKNLQKYGTVLHKDFPYLEEVPNIINRVRQQNNVLLPKAEPFRISAYAKLDNEFSIKNALMQIGAVTTMIAVDWAFMCTGSDGLVPTNLVFNPYMGFHQITIVGWREDGKWICLNSWGKGWGDNGIVYLDKSKTLESWSLTDTIVPQPDPEPITKWYRVQVGAYHNLEYCLAFQQELKDKGLETYLVKIDEWYKVQLGAYQNKDYCYAFLAKVHEMGYTDAFVVYY
jgi:hypothetical protein